MYTKYKDFLSSTLEELKTNGLYKSERIIASLQCANITINTGQKIMNMCVNNYL